MSLRDYAQSALLATSGIWATVAAADTELSRTVRRRELTRTIRATSRLQVRPRVLSLSTSPVVPAGDTSALPPDYELQDKLGEGGMGIVYLARQTSIDRLIAVKMLKPDEAKGDDVRSRFLAEATVTGELDHPNIVPIHDLGCTENGALFYAMKRVRGIPWNEVMASKSLTENLEILMRLADAISFAHSRGIIHRDIKPENVMLGDFGEVLVMDWGLAYSVVGQKAPLQDPSEVVSGSPAYMAPEMAAGTIDQLSFSSDVYLLGATLYEIVAGFPPHSGDNLMGCLFNAAQNNIRPTSKTGELVGIALKAMATRPEDRYASVGDFQVAIREYQSHSESILLAAKANERLSAAQRSGDYTDYAQALFGFREALDLWPGNATAREGVNTAALAYAGRAIERDDLDLALSLLDPEDPQQAEMYARAQAALADRESRNARLRSITRAAQGLAAAVIVILAGSIIWIRSEMVETARARDAAVLAQNEAIEAQNDAIEQRKVAEDREEDAMAALRQERRALLDRDIALQAEQFAKFEANSSARAASNARFRAEEAEQRQKDQRYLAEVSLAGSKIAERSFRHADQLLAASDPGRRHFEWGRLKYVTQQVGRRVAEHLLRINAVDVAADGTRIVTGSWDGSAVVWNLEGQRLATLQPQREADRSYVWDVAFSPDGRRVATADLLGRVIMWDATTGERLLDLNDPTQDSVAAHARGALCLAFVSNEELVSGGADGAVRRWDVRLAADGPAPSDENRLVSTLLHGSRVNAIDLSHDRRRLVSGGQNGSVIVWNLANRTPLFTFDKHEYAVQAVCFTRPTPDVLLSTVDAGNVPLDGTQVISAGDGRMALIWDSTTGQVLQMLTGHDATIRSVQVAPDGRSVVTGSNDNTARLWSLRTGQLSEVFSGHSAWISRATFVPTQSATETRVVTSSHDGDVRLWTAGENRETIHLAGHAPGMEVLSADITRDGRLVATASRDRTVRLWDVATGSEIGLLEEGHSKTVRDVFVSPDGQRVLSVGDDATGRLWDVDSKCQVAVLLGHARGIDTASFSADGRRIATLSTSDGTVRVWEAASGRPLGEFRDPLAVRAGNNRQGFSSVAFTQDGDSLLLGTRSGRVLLQDLAGGEPRTFTGHRDEVSGVVALPDGKLAVSSSRDRTCIVWDLATGEEQRPGLAHNGGVVAMVAAPDGAWVATVVAGEPAVQIWDVASRRRLRTLESNAGSIISLAVDRTGERLAAGTAVGRVILWQPTNGEHLRTWNASPQEIGGVCFSHDGATVYAASESSVGLFEAATGQRTGELHRSSPMMVARFVPNGSAAATQLVTCSAWQPAKLWDVESGQATLRYEHRPGEAHRHLAVSPDGRLVVTVDAYDERLTLWERASGRRLGEIRAGASEEVRSVAFAPSSEHFVATVNDTEQELYVARMYRTSDGELVQQFGGPDVPDAHQLWVLAAEFSPDGQHLLTGGADYEAKLWSVETGQVLGTFLGHTAFVVSVGFSPDGRRILTASEDETAKLWDPASGHEIIALRGHQGSVADVQFSADGLMILTASYDGTARLWPAVDWREHEADPVVARRRMADEP